MSAPSGQGLRQIFDDVSSQTIKFLEDSPGVSKVQLFDQHPATTHQIAEWERANAPCALPDDYKAFLLIADGLLLQWTVRFRGEELNLGSMSLNSLRDVTPVQLDPRDGQVSHDGQRLPKCQWADRLEDFRAFTLDSRMKDGVLALFYPNRTDKPQVWFQDLSCTWNFIANTFTDFFRLMVAHLGLPRWPYVFTQQGIDPAAKQWFRLYSPDRLAIDEQQAQSKPIQASSLQPSAPAPVSPKREIDWNLIERRGQTCVVKARNTTRTKR